jgi:hypothetical protein
MLSTSREAFRAPFLSFVLMTVLFIQLHLKVKVALEEAMKGQSGSRDVAVLFL